MTETLRDTPVMITLSPGVKLIQSKKDFSRKKKTAHIYRQKCIFILVLHTNIINILFEGTNNLGERITALMTKKAKEIDLK